MTEPKKLPDECKFLATCNKLVDHNHYEFLCTTESWIHCRWVNYRDFFEFLGKPSEWRERKP
jgi:hypothetical protein